MAWVRIDDGFYDHRKFIGADDSVIAMWLKAMAWCNRNKTKGAIPAVKIRDFTSSRRPLEVAAELVRRGLWREASDGYEVHDYDVYQNPEHIREKRAAAGRKGAEARWQADGKCHDVAIGLPMAKNGPIPIPIPNPSLVTTSEIVTSLPTVARNDGSVDNYDEWVLVKMVAIGDAWADHQAKKTGGIKSPGPWKKRVRDNLIEERATELASLVITHPDAPISCFVGRLAGEPTRLGDYYRPYEPEASA